MWEVCMCVHYEDCANVMYTINKDNSLNPLPEYVFLCVLFCKLHLHWGWFNHIA
jgi:hypothetical protein